MPKNTWKDITGYSKTDVKVPRSWELIIGNLNLKVTRRIDQNPDVWCWICYEAGIQTFKVLKNKEIEKAKKEAIESLYNILKKNCEDCADYMTTD